MTAPLFALLVDEQLDIYGGPDRGTEYSLENACQKCGAGAEQIGPLRLRGPFTDSVFADAILIVGTRVASTLQSAKLRSVALHPVRVGDS